MATTKFLPQFQTLFLDLQLKKGESVSFGLTVTDYPLDLRNSLVAVELRPDPPGIEMMEDIMGSVSLGSNTITLSFPKVDCSHRCSKSDRDYARLQSIPVYEGDFVSLEGSGIELSRVLSITAHTITVETPATRAVDFARLFYRYRSWSSFTIVPAFTGQEIAVESTATVGAQTINVQSLPVEIPAGETIVFEPNLLARTTELAPFGSRTLKTQPLEQEIPASTKAKLEAFVVIVLSEVGAGGNTIPVNPTRAPIPANTTLHFATRTIAGWKYAGAATVTTTATTGSTSLLVTPLLDTIPMGAIAWFGTLPFNSIKLGMSPDDTRGLRLDNYKYDAIARLPTGEVLRLMEGNIFFAEHVTDFV